ncbi:hypothetical protein Barb7_00117 [Bacteroidales bacterium Barb7]|nr:hypothetical protein Barb7_00117 [Bacteroidales bacterium Barb7]
MRKTNILFVVAGLFVAALISSCTDKNTKVKLPNEEVISIVREAYVYAFPLVLTDATRLSYNGVDNVLAHAKGFPDHTFRNVVAPNNDTNYSSAFLQLKEEPVVIEIPDTDGRYYVFPFLDAWTNNFKLVGKRTTGTEEQKYLVSGPDWKGEVPAGLEQIQAPTNLVWVIGRTQVNSKEDQEKVVSPLQDKYKLTTLSKWLANDPTSSSDRVIYNASLALSIEQGNVLNAVKSLSVEDFFNYFSELLADNPPVPQDNALIKRLASVGIGVGERFSLDRFDAEIQEAVKNVPEEIYAAINEAAVGKKDIYGNVTSDKNARLGYFEKDYNWRAVVAYLGMGALTPEEATYFVGNFDSENQVLDGHNNYIIHFDSGKLPPAEAFWSLTIYDKDRYLSENPIKRYAIGDRDSLKYNADGSLDIYLTHQAPSKDKLANWLPVPNDIFSSNLRIFSPTPEFVKDQSTWQNPLPVRVK